MKALTKLVLIALFSFLVPFTTFAATADVLVVVNGNTEVNRESYNFIRRAFQFNGISYSVAATTNPTSVQPGPYKAVVVLNTGVASGIDPVLEKFITSYPTKKNLYLVNLFQGRSDLTISTFTSANNPEGVDGVTAASTWRGGFGSSANIQKMHNDWVSALANFLKKL